MVILKKLANTVSSVMDTVACAHVCATKQATLLEYFIESTSYYNSVLILITMILFF